MQRLLIKNSSGRAGKLLYFVDKATTYKRY